ncbi:hypothetical protein DRO26_01235 [Candidatus Bathyarchaeota archaeon]|nr:MAG: hypothetical protein DRO26_01235 [Candidatus Bathyarchaeota archaeon]
MNLNWEILIAHNHWITINFCGRKLKVCARCFGVVIGFSTFLTLTTLVEFKFFQTLNVLYQLCFCVGLALPVIIDWVTQTWKLRESNNRIRILTGFLEGASVVFLYLTSLSLVQKIFVLMTVSGLTLNLGFLGEKIILMSKTGEKVSKLKTSK